jgi:tripartite motif-containing protein 71
MGDRARISSFIKSLIVLELLSSGCAVHIRGTIQADASMSASPSITYAAYILDPGNNRIQEFDLQGNFVKTVLTGGSGNGKISNAQNAVVDSQGSFYVVDSGNNRVQKFDENWNYLSQFNDGGSFSLPWGIALDTQGNIWVTDYHNAKVKEFDADGNPLISFNTQGTAPDGISFDMNGNLWVTRDGDTQSLQFYEPSGGTYVFDMLVGEGTFGDPNTVIMDKSGHMWASDDNSTPIHEFDQNGNLIQTFGHHGSTGAGNFENVNGLAFDPSGNLWITDWVNQNVQVMKPDGTFTLNIYSGASPSDTFRYPNGILFAPLVP